MRFRSHLNAPANRSWQRRLIWLMGGLGACIIMLQLLSRGVVPKMLTDQEAASNADSSTISLKPDLDEPDDGQIRAAASEPQIEDAFDDLSISPELLSNIRDNSVGIREAERDVYELLLRRANKASDLELEQAARKVSFSVLMADSRRFIGSIVKLTGDVRRIARLTPHTDRNSPALFEAWLFNEDSGRNPYRIVFSQLPDDFPIADELPQVIRVQTTGYYFKRYGYATADGRLQVAPLILAKTLAREQKVVNSVPAIRFPTTLFGGSILIVSVIVAILWYRMRSADRQFEERFLKRFRKDL